MMPAVYDYVIVGSGFGGSISAMRLAERGHSVLVLERGRRFNDDDFARSTWQLSRYLWAPTLHCFGILEVSPFRDVWALHGAGVGGGSLGYGNVLMEPSPELFEAPAWKRLADWRTVLAPHFHTAKRMLGVTENPRLWHADTVLRQVVRELAGSDRFVSAPVGVYFDPDGQEGVEHPDPFFGGDGPARRSCQHCGACMVGCRHNAKNTLPKNYLFFAERAGAVVRAETEVRDIRPVDPSGSDGARFELRCRASGGFPFPRTKSTVRARNVIVSAGTLGTLRLLFRCRDVTRSLPNISARLGESVRTNSETILGSVSRGSGVDYSRGIAITSVVNPDAVTAIEPVRYPAGSSSMRFLSGPLLTSGSPLGRVMQSAFHIVTHPLDFFRTHVAPGWAQRATILLVMQTIDTRIRLRLGRSLLTGWRRRLVSEPDPTSSATAAASNEIGRRVAAEYAGRTNGILCGSINDGLFGTPLTAHILGGVGFGRSADDGVIDLDCQVFGYPGLYVIDGSVVPGNPGINPSLTIAALAEYAMSKMPDERDRDPHPSPSNALQTLSSETGSL